MEARIKRLFLRKKGKSVEQSLQKNQSSTEEATRTYNLKTSSYDFSDSSPAGRPPRTGSYPIKGKNNRKLSLRHHRHNASAEFSNPSTSDHLHLDGKAPPATSESFDNDRQSSEIIQPGSITGPSTHGGSRQRMPDPPQLEALSSLVLEDREPTRSAPQSSRYGQNTSSGSNYDKAANQTNRNPRHTGRETSSEQFSPAQKVPSDPTRTLESHSGNEPPRTVGTVVQPYPSDAGTFEGTNDGKISRIPQYSVPRTQIDHAVRGQPSEVHLQSSTGSNPTHTSSATRDDRHHLERLSDNSRVSKVLDRPRPISTGPGAARTTKELLDRASGNTADTEVIETIVPAVVHETIHQDIHHARQEVITREIHDHDVYHRILPIIDVEVLPARHFLPVEGGGLVEISANEAPGRGQSWVIAETVSKIPSDVPAPKATSRFSAREFVGDDGDSKKYATAEEFERSEDTWIHPPELETGGRDTGQTWPLVFSDDTGVGVARRPSSRKSPKKKTMKT